MISRWILNIGIARNNGAYRKLMAQYRKESLLILDEWLLYPFKETEARELLDIVEFRYKKASAVFCSQFDIVRASYDLFTACLPGEVVSLSGAMLSIMEFTTHLRSMVQVLIYARKSL